MSEPLSAILIGAGQRGAEVYGAYALQHPGQLRFVAVAEPDSDRRGRFAGLHGLQAEVLFPSWEPLLARPQMARVAVICTQDQGHLAPALAALQAGYDVLLEKPMATTPEGCRQLVATAGQEGRHLQVCHVLRYTPHFMKVREIVQSGQLGQIVHVDHSENVSFWHMAHSYVRGHWGAQAGSSPMILAKCCHDFDLLLWLLDRQPLHLSSAGALNHFRPENAPQGAPEYCLDGCPAGGECPYEASFLYVDMLPFWRGVAHSGKGLLRLAAEAQVRAPGLVQALAALAPPLKQVSGYHGWPRSVVASEKEPQAFLERLRHSPYGRCVYRCDNDVVDHQAVLMAFDGGLTATLTMHGHAHEEHRATRIYGSRASLVARFGMAGAWIEVHEHRAGQRLRYETRARTGGHGGGDWGLLGDFLARLRSGAAPDPAASRQVLEGHLLAFAAERARLESRTLALKDFLQE